MVAALASWLDARANQGNWLLRIEDVDTGRCVAGASELIIGQLAACQLLPDEIAPRQSQRNETYAQALQGLSQAAAVYRCCCSRRQISEYWQLHGKDKTRHAELPYPGTCRDRSDIGAEVRCAVRLRCGSAAAPIAVHWTDRRLGEQHQDLTEAVGDFVLLRRDGLWAYQMAVVVDDAEQGITDIVRGEDLADNTARQIYLQQLLGLPRPRYLHTPLVAGSDGEKLSKQNGAAAVDTADPLSTLQAAGRVLGLNLHAATASDWLSKAVLRWSIMYPLPTPSGKADTMGDFPHSSCTERTP